MRPKYPVFATAACCALALASTAHAKRVIFVANDQESSWGEGYYKQNPEDGDVFVKETAGQTVKDAWGMVEAGDKLIIITHGSKGTITLERNAKGGFKSTGNEAGGTGAKCAPQEVPEIAHDNVSICLLSCHGASDPDGNAGPKTSVKETLEGLLTGEGSSVDGFSTTVQVSYTPKYKNGTDAQKANTLQCLADAAAAAGFAGAGRVNDWLESLTESQHSNINARVIQPCRDAGQDVVDININYSQPTGSTPAGGPAPQTSVVWTAVGAIDEIEPRSKVPCNSFCTVPTCPTDCGGDGEGDGATGIADFLATLAQWGQLGTSCDVFGNGVGIEAFLAVLGAWGPCESICGNGVLEVSEQCDIGADWNCPGLCAPDCQCFESACNPEAGPCCEPNGTPGCDDPECCGIVCGADPFCCDVEWDQICADQAGQFCPACQGQSDCCFAHPGPFCDDPACADQVCQIAPHCCKQQWDDICVGLAFKLCPVCQP